MDLPQYVQKKYNQAQIGLIQLFLVLDGAKKNEFLRLINNVEQSHRDITNFLDNLLNNRELVPEKDATEIVTFEQARSHFSQHFLRNETKMKALRQLKQKQADKESYWRSRLARISESGFIGLDE